MASLKQMWKQDWHKLPNLVTEARLIMCPVPAISLIAATMYKTSFNLTPLFVFVIVVSTDALDGFLARKLNQITELGRRLDPAVDKLLINFTTLAICYVHPLYIPAMATMLIRDVYVAKLLHKAEERGLEVYVTQAGRWKMVAQSFAVASLLINFGPKWKILQISLLTFAVVLSMTTWVDYSRRYSEK